MKIRYIFLISIIISRSFAILWAFPDEQRATVDFSEHEPLFNPEVVHRHLDRTNQTTHIPVLRNVRESDAVIAEINRNIYSGKVSLIVIASASLMPFVASVPPFIYSCSTYEYEDERCALSRGALWGSFGSLAVVSAAIIGDHLLKVYKGNRLKRLIESGHV